MIFRFSVLTKVGLLITMSLPCTRVEFDVLISMKVKLVFKDLDYVYYHSGFIYLTIYLNLELLRKEATV